MVNEKYLGYVMKDAIIRNITALFEKYSGQYVFGLAMRCSR